MLNGAECRVQSFMSIAYLVSRTKDISYNETQARLKAFTGLGMFKKALGIQGW